MANLLYVLNKINAVCPGCELSVGDWSNKATWRIDFQPSATPAQRAAAQAAIDNYVDGEAGEADYAKQFHIDTLDLVGLTIDFNHENRLRAIERQLGLNGSKPDLTLPQFKAILKAML